jgi:hypothetical protein
MLTPANIKNPARKSGYRQVNYTQPNNRGLAKHYQAYAGRGRAGDWRGPTRLTAFEAAVDYCNYANGQPVSPAKPQYDAVTVDLGTTQVHAPQQPPQPSNRKVHTGAHDLYDVVMYDAKTGLVLRRKVGITGIGRARYSGTAKTWGVCIAPLAQAKTFPTKKAARKAERAKVAEVLKDSDWRYVAKEAFAPTKPVTLKEVA